ncbi:MAG: efflux RND transporter periplasmic adaptor subunit [Candidatus Zixiibacteriota bacterium]
MTIVRYFLKVITSPQWYSARWRVFSRFSTMALLALVLALLSCTNDSKNVEHKQSAVAVKVTVVEPSDAQVTNTYTGTLEGEKQAVIYAKIAEAVEAVHVREGEHVKAGQVLISLDKSGSSSHYQEALSLYRNAEKNYKKMTYLYEAGAVSESQFDAAKTEYEVTKASFEAAARLVDIQSPIEGIVTSVNVSKGDYLNPGQQLATVATTDKLRVKFGVNVTDVEYIKQGEKVTVSSESVSQPAEGTVLSVARSADPNTRTFQVEAVIDNHDGLFKPGMFVRVNVTLSQLTDVIVVPRQAVLQLGGGEAVFVVSNGAARQRRVTTSTDLDGRVVIASGLGEGDTLVTLGQDYLQDGAAVNITEVLTGGR